MKALILEESDDRASLVAARALQAAGWTVGAASPRSGLATRSRAVAQFHRIAHTDDGTELFLERMLAALDAGGYDVVFPSWDAATKVLSAHRRRLPAIFPFADHDVVTRALDKVAIAACANAVGIAAPNAVLATPDALAAWQGPLVIKPASHIPMRIVPRRFSDPSLAAPWAAQIRARGGIPVAQEIIGGRLMALGIVVDRDGEPVTVSLQIANHVWPTDAGVTARGVTVEIDAELLERTTALLRSLGWFGLAQLQFLVPDDGVPRLIDFNGRFYGSMALAIRAGANHPVAWARLALDLPTVRRDARPGVRYQWLSRDLRASLRDPQPIRELRHAVSLAPRAAHSLWSPHEPLLAPRFLARQAARKGRRRISAAAGHGLVSLRWRGMVLRGGTLVLDVVVGMPPFRGYLHRRAVNALHSARGVLLACHGNVNRSAFAAALARDRWPGIEITEAGTYPMGDRPSPPQTIAAARHLGVDLSTHRSTVLTPDMLEQTDAIFLFDARNLIETLRLRPSAWRRTHLFGALTYEGPLTIRDPHGTDADATAATFSAIAGTICEQPVGQERPDSDASWMSGVFGPS